ncbi:MAG TPA: NADPH-dependent 2,4-dienoyl-CoA reductase [Xanthobacteraceae bacterium]|nr:NADPH-dependent 2,4-dienoyl-CoA reductase [Xanthobacteraceae bacterium]
MLSPIRVGKQTLRNRVIMGSMHTRLEHADRPVEREAAFYSARARGGAALIITSGYSPNEDGRLEEGAHIFNSEDVLPYHRPIVEAVHRENSKILLQILHSGRYAKHDKIVGPSTIRSPINPRAPRQLSSEEILQTIEDFIRCAELAAKAGYDGVELMGSEGYLINQFTAPRTNNRTDEWGGSFENRIKFPLAIILGVRERLPADFIVMYRISATDLVEGGLTGAEIVKLAQEAESAGADILNTGVGWHEARVPTIAYQVPRAAWAFAAARLKKHISIPIVASNRINMPEVAEQLISDGSADMVSMARPMLADPEFVNKAAAGRAEEINTCIACNQACLDYIFSDRIATCLVNPEACHELDYEREPVSAIRKLAVIGSGPAGMAFAVAAASRGHKVTMYESDSAVGGQLNLARKIPHKTEFNEMLRHFRTRMELTGVEIRLNEIASAEQLKKQGYDHVVVATGIKPRKLDIEGADHPSVLSYIDVLQNRKPVGRRVAIIGMGGIGHDVAELLNHTDSDLGPLEAFYKEWGVDPTITIPGGVKEPAENLPARTITMLQRTPSKPGSRLGISTGWILRTQLKRWNVGMISGATYHKIDDNGLHYSVDNIPKVLAVDNIVVCAGQESNKDLVEALVRLEVPHTVIGGAKLAGELDALRAIKDGTQLGYSV